jgi:hypothetical protein
MAFTAASYNLAGSGVVPRLMARDRTRRALILGDSQTSDVVTDRFNAAWYAHFQPAGGIRGIYKTGFTYGGVTPINALFRASLTGSANVYGVPAFGAIKLPFSPSLGSYGAWYTPQRTATFSASVAGLVTVTSTAHSLVTGNIVTITNVSAGSLPTGNYAVTVLTANTFTVVSATGAIGSGFFFDNVNAGALGVSVCGSNEIVFASGANVADDTELLLAYGNGYVASEATQQHLIYNCATPGWWRDQLNVKTIWHEPGATSGGFSGPSLTFKYRRGFAAGYTTDATTTGGSADAVISHTTVIPASSDPASIPSVAVFSPTGGASTTNRSTRFIPQGWLFESATATKGLTLVPIGVPEYGIQEWVDGTGCTDDTFTQFFAAIGTIDVLVIHLGFNITGTNEETELLAGTTTTYKTNMKAMIARFRAIIGNVPVLLISPYSYDHPTGGTNGQRQTLYGTMLDALKETCDEVASCALINIYTTIGNPQSFIDDTAPYADEMKLTSNGASDRHVSARGCSYFMKFINQQIRDADEVMVANGSTGGGNSGRLDRLRRL